MGNSTHTDTMKAAAYERTTEPVKKNDCGRKRRNTNNSSVNRTQIKPPKSLLYTASFPGFPSRNLS